MQLACLKPSENSVHLRWLSALPRRRTSHGAPRIVLQRETQLIRNLSQTWPSKNLHSSQHRPMHLLSSVLLATTESISLARRLGDSCKTTTILLTHYLKNTLHNSKGQAKESLTHRKIRRASEPTFVAFDPSTG